MAKSNFPHYPGTSGLAIKVFESSIALLRMSSVGFSESKKAKKTSGLMLILN